MEGLRISCARSTYDVVDVREDFHYHKRASPDAIFESKFIDWLSAFGLRT